MITIYALTTPGKMRAYVGCTKGKLAKRWREHRCLLKAGKHTCQKLQMDWTANSFVRESLTPIALETLADDAGLEKKRARELHWMTMLSNAGLLYNEHLVSFRPTDEAIRKGVASAHLQPGNRWTPEVNEKRRLAQLGKPKGHGAKISATKRARREQVMR